MAQSPATTMSESNFKGAGSLNIFTHSMACFSALVNSVRRLSDVLGCPAHCLAKFNSGIKMSMTTTSGCSCSAKTIAARPLSASPMTSISGCALISTFNPSRNISWSSAKRILNIVVINQTHNRRI